MFYRGFKSWCEKQALALRNEIGLSAHDPIEPAQIAESVGIRVWVPGDIPEMSGESMQVLLTNGAGEWSALTIEKGPKRLIIINPNHSRARQNSDIAHEIAHILLKHKPAKIPLVLGEPMLMNLYDENLEKEANWLAGCLLLPREALTHIIYRIKNLEQAKKVYGVSSDMLRYRLNVTGVNRQAKKMKHF